VKEAMMARLGTITDKICATMKEKLWAPLTLAEFSLALQSMAKGKAPSPNGVTMEFFQEYWNIIKRDYFKMVSSTVTNQHFLVGVTTNNLISLLHKGES